MKIRMPNGAPKYLFVFLAMYMLTGCGGSSGAGSEADEAGQTLVADPNTEVQVSQGDSLMPLSEDTEIRVRHEYTTDQKYITVLSGSASLVRGDYELNEDP